VIYNELAQDPRRNITLDWDRMLALDGNSAAYIQYMYARCCSVLRRAADEQEAVRPPLGTPVSVTHPAELDLVRQLARLPVAVRAAGAELAPSEIAQWCYGAARSFAAFYRDCPVLQAESAEARLLRLRLTAVTAQTLRNGLGLLGVRAPERM
jgi:arginyl-tRNA synthetase